MNSLRLNELRNTYHLEAYRVDQIRQAIFRDRIAGFEGITTLPLTVRRQLTQEVSLLTSTVERVKTSSVGNALKALLRLRDGKPIETVLLNPKPGLWSCCISSQVGCAMKCSFCATGTMGFQRHLTSEEITDQVLFWQQYIAQNNMDAVLQNVVYMGMGEPFHNKTEVFASLTELCNPETFGFSARHLSVSTSGLVPVIYEFAERFPQVNLAISLHAANDELR